jgi:hypothetical protein
MHITTPQVSLNLSAQQPSALKTQQQQACHSRPHTALHATALSPRAITPLCPGNATDSTRVALLTAPRTTHLSRTACPSAAMLVTHKATYSEHRKTASRPLRTQPNATNTANSHNCTEGKVVVHDDVAQGKRTGTQQAPHDEGHCSQPSPTAQPSPPGRLPDCSHTQTASWRCEAQQMRPQCTNKAQQ